MDGGVPRWTDEELARLSHEEREELVRRVVAAGMPRPELASYRRRRRFLLVAATGSLVLVPWIGFLAATLPHRYEARHWTLAWVGFDLALLVGLATTAWMAWRGRPSVIFPALVTATLLVCDAWFDTTTAQRSDVVVSALSALLLELPMAAVLVGAVVLVQRQVFPPPAVRVARARRREQRAGGAAGQATTADLSPRRCRWPRGASRTSRSRPP